MYVIADLPKVNHPKFDGYTTVGDSVIAVFRFGYVEKVPADVQAAMSRVRKAVSEMGADVTLVRQWDGSVVLYDPLARYINPEITDADVVSCVQAVKEALPKAIHTGDWLNRSGGLEGVSVKFRLP